MAQEPNLPDEAKRLEALRSYDILDSDPEIDYDSLTRLASYIFQAPIALITLIDEDRQWCKSMIGLEGRETSRELSFCQYTIADPTTSLIIEDARRDPRFANHPMVTGAPHIVFYAGTPIVDRDGYALGSLCVIDHKVRHPNLEQMQALESLAAQLVNLLVLRRTNKALAQSRDVAGLRPGEDRLRSLILEAPVPMCLLAGPDLRIEIANRIMLGYWGAGESVVGKPLLEAQPGEETVRYAEILRRVYDSGQTIEAKAAPGSVVIRGERSERLFDYTFKPLKTANGNTYAVLVMAADVTAQVQRRKDSDQAYEQLLDLFEQAPVAIATIDAKGLTFTHANRFYCDIVGKKHNELVGRPLLEALPELQGQGFDALLRQVLDTGMPFIAADVPVTLQKNGALKTIYVNLSYQAIRTKGVEHNTGVLVVATDVTSQVETRRKVEVSEARFQRLVRDASVGIILLTGKDLAVEMVNAAYGKMVGFTTEQLRYRPIFEVIPEAEEFFRPIIERVMASGEDYHLHDAPYSVKGADGRPVSGYITLVYQPYRDDAGTITGVMVVVHEVTEQVVAQQKTADSERFRQLLTDSVPAMIFYLDDRQRYASYNETFMKWFGVGPSEALGRTTRSLIGEAAYERVRPYLDRAYAGEPQRFETSLPAEYGSRWLSITYTPHIGTDGRVLGIIVHATDITQLRQAGLALRDSEGRFRSLIEEAPFATGLYVGFDLVVETANEEMIKLWGKSRDVVGMPLEKALPELEGQPFVEILREVLRTGVPYRAQEQSVDLMIDGKLRRGWFNFIYKPLRNEAGEIYAILNMAVDVTEQYRAKREALENAERLRTLITDAPAAIGLFLGEELVIDMPNQKLIDIMGKGPDVAGKRLSEVMPELEGERQPFPELLRQVYRTGELFRAETALVKVRRGGTLHEEYFNITMSPLYNAKKRKIYGVLGIAVDVTDTVRAYRQAAEAGQQLADAIEMAELGTWSLDPATGIISYSERVQEWLGITSSVIDLNVSPARVQADDRDRVAAAIRKALEPGGSGRFDEVYTVVNERTGAPRIVHTSGQTVFDKDGKPVRLSGTAQDVTIQRDMQRALERQVQERTEELAAAVEELQVSNEELADLNERLVRSNEELAQYAYVASHDLQEPLRKIEVFSGMLTGQDGLSERQQELSLKINSAAQRMRLLIRDLLDFSRLLQSDTVYQPTDLNATVKAVFDDFELARSESGAQFRVERLPVIEAAALQMNQLFYNLVGNALKFTRPGVPPEIRISCAELATEEARQYVRQAAAGMRYYRICVSDNGIGFAPEYAAQIFEVFKRLHGRDAYPGSGIGLALCRKIVAHHNGSITAESEPGSGATFCLVLPERQ